jgi:hypothetical protein
VPVPGDATEPDAQARSELGAFWTQFAGVPAPNTVWATAGKAKAESETIATETTRSSLIERMKSSLVHITAVASRDGLR